MIVFVVIVIVFKSIIVLCPVVSFIGISVIGVVRVGVSIKVGVVIVLTAFSAPPFITYTVSSLVETGVFNALNAVVCTCSSASIAAFITSVVTGLGSRSNVIHASGSAPEVVALAFAISILAGVSDTMFAVILGCTCAAVAQLVTCTLVEVTCWSAPFVITKTTGLVIPVSVPRTLNARA